MISQRHVFRISKSKLPTLVIIIFLIYLIISFSLQLNKLFNLQQQVGHLQKQVRVLHLKNDELREQIKLLKSDDYIEQKAREKLGLVKPGEARIIPVKPHQE